MESINIDPPLPHAQWWFHYLFDQLKHPQSWFLQVDNDIVQCPGESEEDFSRRRRKVNYLSLAQEFAELQRKNSSATLSDQTENDKESDIETKSVTKERKDRSAGDDFEVYTFRPAFDWGDLNQKIEQATQSQIHQVGEKLRCSTDTDKSAS